VELSARRCLLQIKADMVLSDDDISKGRDTLSSSSSITNVSSSPPETFLPKALPLKGLMTLEVYNFKASDYISFHR